MIESLEGAPRILVIEDSRTTHSLLHLLLSVDRYQIEHQLTAAGGMAAARANPPDLILLDVGIGAQSGFVVCAQLKAHLATRDVPIIFLTGTVDTRAKVRAFDLGAVDYVAKPFEPAELRARVRAALLTKRYCDLLAQHAQIDALTGVWNRRFFDNELTRVHAAATRASRPFAVVLADLDHFKRINDLHGHPVGDAVLATAAAALRDALRTSDRLCRYGGEEFAAIIADADTNAAEVVGERMREAVACSKMGEGQRPLVVTASFGVASSDRFDSFRPDELLAAADAALYQAKRDGRNRVAVASMSNAAPSLRAIGDQSWR